MANEKNLIPQSERTKSEQREIARQGGIASGIARREKKTVQKILDDYLDSKIEGSQTLEAIAQEVGLSSDKSIKELITVTCLINTLKKGDISDLEKIAKLLGEPMEVTDEETRKQIGFLETVKKAVTGEW